MAVGIREVALAAGVSTATVSRAVRNLPNVSARTRARVQQVAAELNYVPSFPASSLATGRTHSVGLLVPSMARWFFANVIEGAERTLRTAGFDVLVHAFEVLVGGPRPLLETESLRRRVDAVVVAGLHLSAGEAQALVDMERPVVFLSVRQPGFPGVGIDDDAAARLATRHLIGLGHRVIGHIGGNVHDTADWSPAVLRRAGWRAEARAAGLEAGADLDHFGNFDVADGVAGIRALRSRRPDMTAVVADSDEMAMGAVQALAEDGVRVPADVSVVGMDGHELGQVVGLTTVMQPAREQGAFAARLVLEALAGATVPAGDALFPIELVVRSSTCPPAS